MRNTKLRNLIEDKVGGEIYQNVWKSFLALNERLPIGMVLPNVNYVALFDKKQTLTLVWEPIEDKEIENISIKIYDNKTYSYSIRGTDGFTFDGAQISCNMLMENEALYMMLPRTSYGKVLFKINSFIQTIKFW